MKKGTTLQNLQTVAITSIVCSLFVFSNFLYANWSGPSANPPQNNVAPQINTSGSIQFKDEGGRIGADYLVGYDFTRFDSTVQLEDYTFETRYRIEVIPSFIEV